MVRKNILIIIFLSLFAQPLCKAEGFTDDMLNVAALSVVACDTASSLSAYYNVTACDTVSSLLDAYTVPGDMRHTRAIQALRLNYSELNQQQPVLREKELVLKLDTQIQDILNTYAPGNKNIRVYKKNYIDTESSKTIESNLAINGVLLNNQSVIDAFLKADNENHLAVRAKIGQEIGHLINKDNSLYRKHQIIAGTSVAMLSLLSFSMIRENLWKIVIPLYVIKRTIDKLILCAVLRHQERRADDHVMQHATNPQELRAMAKSLRADAQAEKEEPSISILFRTHPWAADRIRTIHMAAMKLENQPPQRAL